MSKADKDQAKVFVLVEGPTVFNRLERWEEYLKVLLDLPDNVEGKERWVRRANEVIARKRRGELLSISEELEWEGKRQRQS